MEDATNVETKSSPGFSSAPLNRFVIQVVISIIISERMQAQKLLFHLKKAQHLLSAYYVLGEKAGFWKHKDERNIAPGLKGLRA